MEAERLGAVDPKALGAARAQAHWAAQVISAAGETFLPHTADTSHTAMTWDASLGALVGAFTPGPDAVRVALRVRDLHILLLDAAGSTQSEAPLAGRSLAEADLWTADALRAHTRGRLDHRVVHPGYELPRHPIADGGRFEPEPAGLAELARWYASADRELRELAKRTPGASAVLCWPHHFDIASLVVLATDPAGEATKSVGIGLSPGDDFIAEPYWYVNHGPAALRPVLPQLPAGEWFREEWTGAVLRGTELVAAGAAAAQRAHLRAFLDAAVEASRKLAGA